MDVPIRAATGRPSPLAVVHKALRRLMFETLVATGAMDLDDEAELARGCAEATRLLDLLVEPAPELRLALAELAEAPRAARGAAAARVYDGLAAVVTDRLQRLARDEAACTPLLLARYSDEQLSTLRRQRLAGLMPQELRDALRWMSGALSPQELAQVLADLHAGAPAEALRCALEVLGEQLGPERWQQLARALHEPAAGPPPAPLPARPERRRGAMAGVPAGVGG